jgi:hypothetical protein
MTVVLPNGFLTILQAADTLLPAMYGGVLDRPIVKRLRDQGLDVSDGSARDRAIEEIWKAVDAGKLRPLAIGGRPRKIIRLDDTKSIPTLRSARGRGFAMLRQSNPAYHQLASYFGPLVCSATLAFRETDIRKLAARLLRARRAAQKSDNQKNPRGRPSQIKRAQMVIRDVIAKGRWNVTASMKALAREVNRAGKYSPPMSDDTVTRALDLLYEETNDRRFARVRRERRPRRK